MAILLPFAAEAKRGRKSQSWTCLCQRRLRQAWSGLQLIATGAEVPGERISILRFPCPRPSADEKRDGRATFHLHAVHPGPPTFSQLAVAVFSLRLGQFCATRSSKT